MKRRAFIALGGSLLAGPIRVLSQTGVTRRIGLGFHAGRAAARPLEEAFIAGLRDHGRAVGRDLVIEVRYADGDAARLAGIADELIALKPDVLVGYELLARILKAKTSTIPIVLTNSSDPVGIGLVQSLARPGGNVTGLSSQWEDLVPKTIEIFREILGHLGRVAMLLESTYSGSKAMEAKLRATTKSLGAAADTYYVSDRTQIEKAFAAMDRTRPDILLIGAGGMLLNNWRLIAESAEKLRVPFSTVPGAPGGEAALYLFGPDFVQGYRDAAKYVDRILKGAKPAELPIEQPTRFQLIVNLKVARSLGLTIPQAVLLRADRVIE